MAYYLATIRHAGASSAAIVIDDRVHPLPGVAQCGELIRDWRTWHRYLDAMAVGADRLGAGLPADQVELLPPVPYPPNVYMVGANYREHALEMDGGASEDKLRPPDGPFMFLRPTTSLVGHRQPIEIEPGSDRMDWEVELAVVIGRRAHRVPADEARAYIAGYTIVNDVSNRGRFERALAAMPFKWDWFMQKGWHTTCPIGPWLLPASCCPAPERLAISLTVNGVVEQSSSTASMLFSIEEQIEHLSAIIPLLPGDIICTGTPSGVGASKNRFLRAGDVMVAEIEDIGSLENEVVIAAVANGTPRSSLSPLQPEADHV